MDWSWLSEDTPILPHGWTPESGFLQYRWDDYSEMMMMYLLGLGSSNYPLLPPEAWDAWKRTLFEYDGDPIHRFVRAALRSPIFAGMV